MRIRMEGFLLLALVLVFFPEYLTLYAIGVVIALAAWAIRRNQFAGAVVLSVLLSVGAMGGGVYLAFRHPGRALQTYTQGAQLLQRQSASVLLSAQSIVGGPGVVWHSKNYSISLNQSIATHPVCKVAIPGTTNWASGNGNGDMEIIETNLINTGGSASPSGYTLTLQDNNSTADVFLSSTAYSSLTGTSKPIALTLTGSSQRVPVPNGNELDAIMGGSGSSPNGTVVWHISYLIVAQTTAGAAASAVTADCVNANGY